MATITGTDGADTLFATNTGDVVFGLGGDDYISSTATDATLYGGDGNDTLDGRGGGGNDRRGTDLLDGGAGADLLHGNYRVDPFNKLEGHSGTDTFQFDSVSDFGDGRGDWDTIMGYHKGDVIDLTRIDADATQDGQQHFDFIGRAHFDGHAGELRWAHSGRGNIVVTGDVNGDGVADFELMILNKHQISAADFHL